MLRTALVCFGVEEGWQLGVVDLTALIGTHGSFGVLACGLRGRSKRNVGSSIIRHGSLGLALG